MDIYKYGVDNMHIYIFIQFYMQIWVYIKSSFWISVVIIQFYHGKLTYLFIVIINNAATWNTYVRYYMCSSRFYSKECTYKPEFCWTKTIIIS